MDKPLVVSDLNDHIGEKGEVPLEPRVPGDEKGTVGPLNPGEKDHHLYLHAADPLFQYANANGMFPDDYAHVLASLEESTGNEAGHAEPAEEKVQPVDDTSGSDDLSIAAHDSGLEEEKEPQSLEMPDRAEVPEPVIEEEEEPSSAFVQWLIKREKPRAPGEVKAKRKGKNEKESMRKPAERKSGRKGNGQGEPVLGLDSGASQVKSKKTNRKKEQGIQLSPDVISETLAEVLASQGHIHAAIEMYEKLGLIYPEKKSFFAVKIENLKNT